MERCKKDEQAGLYWEEYLEGRPGGEHSSANARKHMQGQEKKVQTLFLGKEASGEH